jgi:cell division protein FtsB
MAAGAARAATVRSRARRRSGGSAPARRGGIRWDRVARISLLLVLGIILISYIGPATAYLRGWNMARDTRSEVHRLARDNAALRARSKRLQDLQTVELEARRAGMGRPGERVYVIRGLPKGR